MRLTFTALLLVVCANALVAQESAPCARVSFGTWNPPLDWLGSGHADSAAILAEKLRRIRDSVFAGSVSSTGARDEMLWTESRGRLQLVIFPSWWPAGVAITFAGDTLGDTLRGQARALVADLGKPVSMAPARVIRAPCRSGQP